MDAVEAVRSVSKPTDRRAHDLRRGCGDHCAGITAAEASQRLAELDVAAMGANHGAGLLAALHALDEMGKDGKPLAALPNIGLASLAGGR